MEPPYLTSTKAALLQVQLAIDRATELLPPAVQQQHWIRKRLSPAPWPEIASWYREHHDPEYGQETAAILSHLVWLAEARETLHGLLIQAEVAGRTPDLSLPRVRRSQ